MYIIMHCFTISWYSYERHDIFSRLCFHFHRFAKVASFGAGGGSILMDDVNCGGKELDIADCGFLGWFTNDCSHGEDVGLSCGVYMFLSNSRCPCTAA